MKTASMTIGILGLMGQIGFAAASAAQTPNAAPQYRISTIAGGALPLASIPATSVSVGNPTGVATDPSGNVYFTSASMIFKLSGSGLLTRIAGTTGGGYSGDGGPAANAQLNFPHAYPYDWLDWGDIVSGIAVDSQGSVYVADMENNRVRKVSPAGTITTAFGPNNATPELTGVAIDQAGNLFVVSPWGYVTKVSPDGNAAFVPGTGWGCTSSLSKFQCAPTSATTDAMGNLYISDSGHCRVQKVDVSGIITTVAGSGNCGYSGDGFPAVKAQLGSTGGLAVDAEGNLYISDTSNSRIRKVSPTGIITTLAGRGSSNPGPSDSGYSGDGGPAENALLSWPYGVAVDSAGNVYIADTGNFRIRRVSTNGIITTVAGNGRFSDSGDGGPAAGAQLNLINDRKGWAGSLSVDRSGNIDLVDAGNNRYRRVTPNGVIQTIAEGVVKSPTASAVDADGNRYVVDCCRVQKIAPNGAVSIVAAIPADPPYLDEAYGPFYCVPNCARSNVMRTVALDTSGNVYFNNATQIFRLSADGIVTVIAGSGAYGYSGDGGLATDAELTFPAGIAVAENGAIYIADAGNNAIRVLIPSVASIPFSIAGRGAESFVSAGVRGSVVVGYASIQANNGEKVPSGLAIFGLRENGILVSESGFAASAPFRSGRLYVEASGPVNTGVAIANPNDVPATVSFFFSGKDGDFGVGSLTIPARGQIARFLDQEPFGLRPPFSGALTFNASAPVASIALRGLTNERGEFLTTAQPVVNLDSLLSQDVYFPHFADGDGFTTQIILVNPTDRVLNGAVQFRSPSGAPAFVLIGGQLASTFAYSIPSRSSQKLETSGTSESLQVGYAHLAPATNTPAPSGLIVFSLHRGGIVVSEAGVPAVTPAGSFLFYAESSGDFDVGGVGSTQTGLAIANPFDNIADVVVEVYNLDGSSAGFIGNLQIPGQGQKALFLREIPGLRSMPPSFQGVLRVSATTNLSVMGIRGRYNERRDFLFTDIPAVNEDIPLSTPALVFPHIVDSGGYTTQFVLFGSPSKQSSGVLQFFSQTGETLGLEVR